MRRIRPVVVALVVCGALLASSSRVSAQRGLTIAAGLADYDLSGTGRAATAHGYVERPISSWLRVEYGTGLFYYRTQFGGHVGLLLPEVGITAQGPTFLPLYLGVGAGYSVSVLGDRPHDPTLYGTLGLDLPFGHLRLRPELRVRALDPWAATIGSYTLGVTGPLGS